MATLAGQLLFRFLFKADNNNLSETMKRVQEFTHNLNIARLSAIGFSYSMLSKLDNVANTSIQVTQLIII